MLELSEKECINYIENEKLFHAEIENGAFSLKIEDYSFFICTAIHNGHHLRESLSKRCLLNDEERLYEEDPHTGELIFPMPISFIAHDSRYEYDLNRSGEECVYETAWGKKVWSDVLSIDEINNSISKHNAFYNVLEALIKKIEQKHGNCIIYDIHSYNHLRIEGDTPAFNIGTEQVDETKWGKNVNNWVEELGKCELPNLTVRAALNEVFYGKGYLAEFVKDNFNKTLVLPTEVKKIFMDENNGSIFPLVFSELKEFFKQALLANALHFSRQHTYNTYKKKNRLLSRNIEPAVLKVDKSLYRLCKGIETLVYLNPKNLTREKKLFFRKKYEYSPDFIYPQLDMNPSEFREKLYRLPVDEIKDITIQQLYRDVIDSFATKIDLLKTVGTEKFLYNSLRYYGEPNTKDIQAAHFILYSKDFEDIEPQNLNAEMVKEAFDHEVQKHGIKCKVEITDKIVASAMVNNSRKLVLINKSININSIELNALIQHELGVHMFTTANSELQNLKVFKLGLPGNTSSQEGLAILSEYLSGNITLKRLKTLALRVIAVKIMTKNYDFTKTFKILLNDYNVDKEEAFKITARVYRGGGFTKDYLYLRGIKEALSMYSEHDLSPLLIGKTSFPYLNVINEMIERKMVDKPKYIPLFLNDKAQVKQHPIMEYLITSL